ncbi:hypothetical protein PybrP1_007973 [[Pythium] brassicae (nom. inval.)]|nr:hypothetical protein PybrP1_007973 [[Pythium] brassicae (nom. inval.)]
MSSIEKLSIRGIRSFSPNREEIIEFFHPLTVILGDNGCGKTTIIECLKIVCTGALPPGARGGQSFVHDPKIAGTNEVKASIRLRFRNSAGKAMVVQRTYQLTQLRSQLRFKAMDGVIRVVNELGEKVSMGHKCGELDRHIPDLLGVSRAILESVIFCHQEDSNWPLQEGAELKKRFDAIFESARYTKALEAIRKLRKARHADTKDFKRDLDVLAVTMKAADAVQDKIDAAEAKLAALSDDAARADDGVAGAEEALAELEQLLAEVRGQRRALATARAEAQQKDESVERAYRLIDQVMSDADEELEALLSNYEAIIGEHRQAFERLKAQEARLAQQQRAADAAHATLAVAQGSLEAKVEAQQVVAAQLLDLAARVSTMYSVRPALLTPAGNEVQAFLATFQRAVQAKQNAVKDVENANQRAEDALTAEVSELHARLHHVKEELKRKQRELGELGHEKRQTAAALKQLSDRAAPSERDVTELEHVVEAAERKLQAHRAQHDALARKAEIQALNRIINDAAFESSQLDQQINVLRMHESEHVALDAGRKELRRKEDALTAKLAEKATEFHSVFAGAALTLDAASLPDCVRFLDALVADRTHARDAAKRELARVESSVQENALVTKHLEAELATLRADKSALERNELGTVKALVAELSPGASADVADAERTLAALEKTYFDAKDKTLRCKNTITFLTIFKRKGESEGCCPLCLRGMDDAERAAFRAAIDDKTDDRKVKDKISRAESHERAAHAKWKDMERCMPSWRKWTRIAAQLPVKSSELDAAAAAQTALLADVADKKRAFDSAQRALDDAQQAQRKFATLSDAGEELAHAQTRLASEQQRLQAASAESLGADAPSLAAVLAARDSKQSALQDLNRELQLKQAALQSQQEVQQQLQTDLLKKREDKLRLDQQRKDYDAALEAQSKLRDREQALREAERELRDTEPALERDVRAKTAEREARRADATARRNQLRAELQQHLGDLRTFSDKVAQVQESAAQDPARELRELAQTLAQTKAEQAAVARALEDLAPQLASALKNLEQQESFRRQIRDNLHYRELKREGEAARREIAALEQQLQVLPAEEDIGRRVRAAQAATNKARDRRAELKGRQQQLDDQVRDYRVQLFQTEFRNVEDRYRKKLIEFETTTMAVADLDKYFHALDQALIEYHSKKIEEINTIIRSLWQITYKGQDIDSIEIVSGQEGGGEAAPAKKNSRSYDYRVVMKKGGAKIDMRGRCSAGQKVLAALVIRLALAETFCLNCGILALDEPTTNLDTENKYGLAQAITDLLTARSSQQNFQLVCITHDEEFVQMLGRTQAMDNSSPEYYWRISREELGNNRFYSKIDRREWRDGI